MKSKQKLWVMLTLVCLFIGGGFWLVSANKDRVKANTSTVTSDEGSTSTRVSLRVGGRYQELKFEDAADLPELQAASFARPQAMANADINNDGVSDLVGVYNNASGSELRVRLNTAAGTLENLPQSYSLNIGNSRGFTLGDFDHDGTQDIANIDEAGRVVVMLNNQGSFQPGATFQLGESITRLTTADFNRDTLDDLVAIDSAKNSLQLVLGNGDLAKAKIVTLQLPKLGQLSDVKVADLNNDFYDDLIVASNSGVGVLYGNGQGQFTRETKLAYANLVTGLVVTDLNGDHFPDVAVSSPTGVTVWRNRGAKGFANPQVSPAGDGAHGLVAGNFNADGFTDLAVINDNKQVSVLLNGKKGFSSPLVMDVDRQPLTLAAGNFRNNGVDGLAIGKDDGNTVIAINPRVITLQVSTLNDENDCPACTSAQLTALRGPLGAPGGGTGISLREAITAINNDFILNGTMNQGVGFATLSSTSGANLPNVESDVRSFCGPMANGQTYWFLAVMGNLPPLLAPGTMIDGTVVNTDPLSGVTNTLGPKIVISGGGLVVTSSAPGAFIRGLAIIMAPGNGITINSNNNQILMNNIGLDCDTMTAVPNAGIGIVLSGASTTQVTSNFIAANGMGGVQVNGISLSLPLPQNNVFDRNTIGLSSNGLARPNIGDGIRVQAAATGNTIRNSTISANTGAGINVSDNITSNTIITNNRIGTDPAGIAIMDLMGAPLGNMTGISLSTMGNSKFNMVSQNVISGNLMNGLMMSSGDTQAQFSVVTSNKIGVNVSGSVQLPNGANGITITGSANQNTIGGQVATLKNQIAGNTGFGLQIGAGMGLANPNNNLISNNDIGANNLGTGAPFDPATPNAPQPRSNKMGGVLIDGAAFANTLAANNIAFNGDAVGTMSGGIGHMSTGNFNKFTANNIFLNPPDGPAIVPQINVVTGNQGITNAQITPMMLTSLIKIDSAITVTSTGQTTIKGTVNFIDNGVIANINGSAIEVFVSRRGSEMMQAGSEGQLFLGSITSLQPNPMNPNALDWSANLSIPAPFINPVQTNTVFLTATVTTGDGSTSGFSIGRVPQFVNNGGGQCALGVSSSTLNFRDATINQANTQMLTLTNNGSTIVTVTAASLMQNANLFAVSTPTLPFILNPGASQTLMVSFTPTNNTMATATLNIANSCTGTTTVSLTGNGCQPTLAVTPNMLNFGTVPIGMTAQMDVMVTNSGCQPANTTFSFTSSVGGNANSFTVAPVPNTNNMVRVTFSPGAVGTINATLMITAMGASNSPASVSLTGVGATPPAPVLRIQPANLIFSDIPIGTTAMQTVTLINAGNVALNINPLTLLSGGDAGFSFAMPARLMLAPNDRVDFSVSFRPNQIASVGGLIQVTSNGGTLTITLAGNGAAASIAVPSRALDFGMVSTGTTRSQTLIVTNIGQAPLTLTGITISGSNSFNVPSTTTFPLTIMAGASAPLNVNFAPGTSGQQTGVMQINSNDPVNPQLSINLNGTGLDATAPRIQLLSPNGGETIASGQPFMVQFTAMDESGLGGFEVRLSTDGGASFGVNIANGVAQSGQNAISVVVPNGIESSQARVQVLVRDNANNTAMATSSGNFTLGTPPALVAASITNGRFRSTVSGSNIQTGAVLVINGESFALTMNSTSTSFIVRRNVVGSQGRRFSDVARPGASLSIIVRNPSGLSSAAVNVTAQ